MKRGEFWCCTLITSLALAIVSVDVFTRKQHSVKFYNENAGSSDIVQRTIKQRDEMSLQLNLLQVQTRQIAVL